MKGFAAAPLAAGVSKVKAHQKIEGIQCPEEKRRAEHNNEVDLDAKEAIGLHEQRPTRCSATPSKP